MLKSYLQIAWRILWKNKVFSFINIIGLALSMAACLALALYIWNELHHDDFHTQAKSIYRITSKQNQAGNIYNVAVTPGPLADAIKKDFPEIKSVTRLGNWSGILKNQNKVIEEKAIQIAENSFFQMFDFPLLIGNKKTVLKGIDEIVITERVAENFFGPNWKSNPSLLSEIFSIGGGNFKLAGVAANPPFNSSIRFDVLLPLPYMFKTDEWSYKWGSNNYHTYIQLNEGVNVGVFTQKLSKQIQAYKAPNEDQFLLQPLQEQYLYSKFDFFTDWGNRSESLYVKLFSGVGILLLLIACINYINLSTARSIKRSMEIGVRKINGASRSQLILQFLTESFLVTLIAGLFSLILLKFLEPFLTDITGDRYTFSTSTTLFVSLFISFIVLIAIAAGIYPAIILSAKKPIQSIKGISTFGGNSFFRKGLVILQFSIAAALMISTLFIYKQLIFMQEKDLGFNSEQVIRIRLGDKLRGNVLPLQQDLKNESSFVSVAPATMTLSNVDNSTNFEWEGMKPDETFLITQANIDPEFIPTMGITLIRGENFRPQSIKDTINNYIINETAVRAMGKKVDEVVGTKATFWGAKGTIVGVVKDFHFKPLTSGIEPFLFRYQPWAPYFHLFATVKPGKAAEAIKNIERHYKKYEPETPLEFTFLNDSINEVYKKDKQTASVLFLFTCLTIVVGCLGLFGLTVFAAEQRIKEIGIRKVLGAGVFSIAKLLSIDFLKPILAAIIIALPIAWYAIHVWLQNYAYRVPVNWLVFAICGGCLISIAIVTISFQAVKAAMDNPVKSLRTE